MEIQVFNHNLFGQVRAIEKDGVPWFVGKDVASALGYKDPKRAIYDHVLDKDKITVLIQHPETNRKSATTIINESGLFKLIFGSKLQQAEEFTDWVTSVVLPQIRKTGGYIPVGKDDDEKAILAKALLITKRTIEEQQKQLEEQKPDVQFAKAVQGSEGSILIGGLAKLIAQNGINIGQNRLFEWLREHEYIGRKGRNNNVAYQRYIDQGLFELEDNVIDCNHGSFLSVTTLVTPSGQKYFVDGFINGKFTI